jgi:hypothetical protein
VGKFLRGMGLGRGELLPRSLPLSKVFSSQGLLPLSQIPFLTQPSQNVYSIGGADHRAMLAEVETERGGVFGTSVFAEKGELVGNRKGGRGEKLQEKIVDGRTVAIGGALSYVADGF